MKINREEIRRSIARCDYLASGRDPDHPERKMRRRGHDGTLFCKYSLRKREQRLRTALQLSFA